MAVHELNEAEFIVERNIEHVRLGIVVIQVFLDDVGVYANVEIDELLILLLMPFPGLQLIGLRLVFLKSLFVFLQGFVLDANIVRFVAHPAGDSLEEGDVADIGDDLLLDDVDERAVLGIQPYVDFLFVFEKPR